MSDNTATLVGFLGAFLMVVLISWSLAWYYDNKNEHRRPNVANVILTCQSSTDLQVDCKVKS